MYDVIHQILTGRIDSSLNKDLVVSLFRDGHLLNRIVEAQKRNDAERYINHHNIHDEDPIH